MWTHHSNTSTRPQKKEQNKTKPVLQADGGSAGQDFFFSDRKMILKTQFLGKNRTFFAVIFLKKKLVYFQKFLANILRFWSKKG